MKARIQLISTLSAAALALCACGKPSGDTRTASPPATETPAKTKEPPAKTVQPANPNEISLFDGKSLGKWKRLDFGDDAKVEVKDGVLEVGTGLMINAVAWDGDPPAKTNFEVELEGRKTDGSDFLLGLTVPVGESHISWICGGWGDSVVGLSNINGLDASENDTALMMGFEKDKWYRFKMRVEPERIQCWIDGESVIDANIKDKEIGLRWGDIEMCVPIGLATYQTTAQYRNIVWRNLPSGKE